MARRKDKTSEHINAHEIVYTNKLTPEQRLKHISDILAKGVIRLIKSKRRNCNIAVHPEISEMVKGK